MARIGGSMNAAIVAPDGTDRPDLLALANVLVDVIAAADPDEPLPGYVLDVYRALAAERRPAAVAVLVAVADLAPEHKFQLAGVLKGGRP